MSNGHWILRWWHKSFYHMVPSIHKSVVKALLRPVPECNMNSACHGWSCHEAFDTNSRWYTLVILTIEHHLKLHCQFQGWWVSSSSCNVIQSCFFCSLPRQVGRDELPNPSQNPTNPTSPTNPQQRRNSLCKICHIFHEGGHQFLMSKKSSHLAPDSFKMFQRWLPSLGTGAASQIVLSFPLGQWAKINKNEMKYTLKYDEIW